MCTQKFCLCLFRPAACGLYSGAHIRHVWFMHRDFAILCSPIQSMVRFLRFLSRRLGSNGLRYLRAMILEKILVVIVFHFDFNGAALRVFSIRVCILNSNRMAFYLVQFYSQYQTGFVLLSFRFWSHHLLDVHHVALAQIDPKMEKNVHEIPWNVLSYSSGTCAPISHFDSRSQLSISTYANIWYSARICLCIESILKYLNYWILFDVRELCANPIQYIFAWVLCVSRDEFDWRTDMYKLVQIISQNEDNQSHNYTLYSHTVHTHFRINEIEQ